MSSCSTPDLLLGEYKLPLREDLVEVCEKMLDTGQTGLDTTLSAQNVLVGTEQKEVRAGTRDWGGGGGETLSTIRTFAHGVAVLAMLHDAFRVTLVMHTTISVHHFKLNPFSFIMLVCLLKTS